MDPDLQQLIEVWLSDDWDSIPDLEATLTRLSQRLRQDALFRESFVQELATLGQLKAVQSSEPRWLELEDLLSDCADDGNSHADLETLVMRQVSNMRSSRSGLGVGSLGVKWLYAGVAASLLLATALGIWARHSGSEDATPLKVAVERDTTKTDDVGDAVAVDTQGLPGSEVIAVLSQAVDARWGGQRQLNVGDSLHTGPFVLKRGTVQIEFFAGVRLLVRAPADFELIAADEVLLREGDASCFVTEMGRGFKITTADMQVIDLGTAFSIKASDGKQSEVHVLEGAVEIKSHGNDAIELTERKAMRTSTAGLEPMEYSPERFPQTVDLRDQQRREAAKAYRRWKQQAKEISSDPDVLLHYTFEEADPSALELTNRASNGGNATDGVVIGCDWSEGRWPMKRALLYRNANDRVLFQVPGSFDEITFLAWVRLDGLTQQNTSLLMTENPARRLRFVPMENDSINDAVQRLRASSVKTVRWELTRLQSNVTFSIGHGLQNLSDYERIPASSPSTRPDRWGHWACMAVTCDAANRTVAHYLDGQLIGQESLRSADPLLLDFMELGNFGASDEEIAKSQGDAVRRFYGAFDELVVARRVMTAAEIKAFWLHGKP